MGHPQFRDGYMLLIAIFSLIVASSNDTNHVFVLHKSQSPEIIIRNQKPNAANLSANSNLIQIAKIYEELRMNIGCEADGDTLDMAIVINQVAQSVKIEMISEYEGYGAPDSLMKYASNLAQDNSGYDVIKIRYLTMCSNFGSDSRTTIANELMHLNQNDSVVVLIPEYPCLHVNGIAIRRDAKWKYCENTPRFKGVPIRFRHKIKLNNFNALKMKGIVDSIGFKPRALAACTELRGLIVGYKMNNVKVFKFDACNGYVDYRDHATVGMTNLKSNAYDQILKMFRVDDHFWDEEN